MSVSVERDSTSRRSRNRKLQWEARPARIVGCNIRIHAHTLGWRHSAFGPEAHAQAGDPGTVRVTAKILAYQLRTDRLESDMLHWPSRREDEIVRGASMALT